MTRVTVFSEQGNLTKVFCEGHTGYAEEGEDIVCAALSSVVQTAALGLLQVVGINISLKREDKEGIFEFSLPDNLSQSQMHDAQIVLNTMLCGVSDLYESYSDFIELEVI